MAPAAAVMFLFIISAGKLDVKIQEFTTHKKCADALRIAVEISRDKGADATGFCTPK